MMEGRYEYPPDPFTLVEVTGYVGTGEYVNGLNDGDWWAVPNGDQRLLIKHRRNNDSVYGWSYFSGDFTDRPSDDRGVNIGKDAEGFAGMDGACLENCD